MYFKINRNFFIEEINKCSRIIDYKILSPILTGVFIEVTTDKISLISTNTVVSIKSEVFLGEHDLVISETGSVLIKAKYFLEILRRMDDEIISVSKVEDNVVSLAGDKSEFVLNVLDDVEYPIIAFREKGSSIMVDTQELKKSLNQTIISVNEYNQKIVLSGLNFSVENETFYVTGTDGYRVSRKKIFLPYSVEEKFEANIPYKSVLEITKILSEKNETKINIQDNFICFKVNNTFIQSTLLEGQFPNVSMVFPTDFNTTIYTENRKIVKLISRADIPSEETTSTVVNLILNGESIFVKSNIQQIGSFEEEFKDFEIRGLDEQNIYFNSKFILESLKSFETKTIEINLIDAKKPIVISSNEDQSLSQIILPMFSN
ncbi:DNA polymerase III subunit beta [Spiroplasma culicicola]|uniref:Beta sliding clamp n=1 Tax=Spiroplasma culicicola AES-1 TaxID=1276246 RepID=W6A5E2_9MOLU|nr:DNA polymerase III subunit beta [Spiroplasma culicicola]AHI52343.1 DNA polymerase III subunit beta [Spiroplasma culicicola AES-1]